MPLDGIPDGYRAGLEDLVRVFTPPARKSIAEWAGGPDGHPEQAKRILTSKTSAYPGPWRNDRVPYLPGIMDALDDRHPAPIIVVCKSAQSCVSEVLLNWIGRSMDAMPAAFLALWPSVEVGKKWTRTRVRPMILGVPGMRMQMSSGQKRPDSTLLELHWPGGVLNIGSMNKPDDVATVSVPNIIVDDADRAPLTLAGEGDPFELALMRSSTFERRKAAIVSTPTDIDRSRIWPWWLRSTMDRFFVPCIHCNHMQHLRFAQLKWIKGKPSSAMYECEECSALMENRHKKRILADGEWRAEHPERETQVKGFHVSGLYAPVGLGYEWALHADAWERAQGSDARIQVFYNTRLGEVHKGERQRVEWAEIKARAEPYALRSVPRGTLLLVSGTDVQADRLETQVLGFGRGERIVVVDTVVHYGDTTRLLPSGDGEASVWAKLDEYLAGAFQSSRDVPMRLSCSLVDSGYLTDVVLGFTRPRKARNIFACRGSANASRQPIGRPSYPDVKRRGKADTRGAERYELGVSMLKHWLFEALRADAGKPDAPVLPADRHIRFSNELPDEYYRQLTAETYDPKHGWIPRANYHRNESLDTFVYARAAAMHHSVAVHRLRDADWERLESLYEPAAGGAKPTAPVLGVSPIARMGSFLPTSAQVRNE
jgi:phage terminase large subunit GpA-like protein